MGKGPIHAFLDGSGLDSRGRSIATVLAFDDIEIEATHDFIQWLFPLPFPSMAQPLSPILSDRELSAIRDDAVAIANLKRASDRMAKFYATNGDWLTWHDHNHLRITRVLTSLRLIAGLNQAKAFYAGIAHRVKASPQKISPRSMQFWEQAVAAGD